MKQIMFVDLEDSSTHGGIELDNGDVICGCCGGLFEANEHGTSWQKIREYSWISLDEIIIGDVEE